MKKILDDFTHKMGSHCSSTLMRDILEKHKIKLSEEMVFGIGSGLGFLYRKCWSPAYYMILGRGHDLEEKLGQHMGFFTEIDLTYDDGYAWDKARKMIDSGNPVLVEVDAAELPYMRERFDLFDMVRYGGHKVCMIGYSTDDNEVYLYDYAWKEIQTVTTEVFQKARSADVGEFPVANMWFDFAFPKKLKPIEQAIIEGIGFNVHTMLHPVTTQTGLMGMEKFFRQAPIWTITFSEEEAKKNAYMVYMMLETVGTGGGNFRRIYARFLKQAGNILRNDDIFHISELYFDLADKWRKIAKLFLRSSKSVTDGIYKNDEATLALLNETKQLEFEGMNQLSQIITSKYSQYYLL